MMKKSKIKKLFAKAVQVPLRFHHQDIHQELTDIQARLARIEYLLTHDEDA